jgi:aminoglycoside phosphotransferase (APT) family kinase protein
VLAPARWLILRSHRVSHLFTAFRLIAGQRPLKEYLTGMTPHKLHAGEIEIDADLVRRLIAAQLPHLRKLPISEIVSTGTVNAIFRLGGDLSVRLPRLRGGADDLERELEWLPKLVGRLPLAVPEPMATGRPGDGFPFPWAVYRWIEGETYSAGRVDDECQAATDLAGFITQLRRIDRSGAPPTGRAPLRELDAVTLDAIQSLRGVLDTNAASAAWDMSLEAPPWDGNGMWLHCDLLPSNLLVAAGRLKAIIDFGSAGIGDPAQDVVPAWSVFDVAGRLAFRNALGVDDATWARARAYALHQALLIIPYYRETNPRFVDAATRTTQRVIHDLHL